MEKIHLSKGIFNRIKNPIWTSGLSWFKRAEDRQDKRILMRTQGRSEDLEFLISQEKSGWFLEENIEEELKKEEYNQKNKNILILKLKS